LIAASGRRVTHTALWLALLTLPYWLNWIGGYTALGSRVLVLALAAMSVSFLLGFTGVLSFGHAAYSVLAPTGSFSASNTWCRIHWPVSPSASVSAPSQPH
jgi:branched-chain amino acid transport system permease protein